MDRQAAADVTKALHGKEFPCTKQDLMRHARRAEAPQEVLDLIQDLPDHQFNNMAEVIRGLGAA